ncbi:hypothetical protein NPIL_122541 [Nephila pilipes]|uniref:Uncharacterized protein n=1 Tax=Nephila pilipes TaxID=299642 RepID=A0A8X6P2A0_NEPPI|nr:hypothetical protein NPIL_122541 [Nephila pilipes]
MSKVARPKVRTVRDNKPSRVTSSTAKGEFYLELNPKATATTRLRGVGSGECYKRSQKKGAALDSDQPIVANSILAANQEPLLDLRLILRQPIGEGQLARNLKAVLQVRIRKINDSLLFAEKGVQE